MKSILVIFLTLSVLTSVSYADDEKPKADAVVVKVLKAPLPHDEGEKGRFLWDNFANKPDEQKFDSYTIEKWQETFKVFAEALVKKAEAEKLDSASLRKTLDLVLKHSKDEIAYLPIGAYQTTLDGELVWIVTVKWEYPSMSEKDHTVGLSHIRAFVFDQKTLKQVGFMTCG